MPFVTTSIPQTLYRISRVPDPATLPSWEHKHDDGTFGNRWDDPRSGFRVLYTTDSLVGALVETLQGFRHSLRLLERLKAVHRDDPGLKTADEKSNVRERISGFVPPDFFENRYAGAIVFRADANHEDAKIVNVAAAETIQALRAPLSDFANNLGIDDINLATMVGDLPHQFHGNRRMLTQHISRYLYDLPEHFGGIACPSSLGIEHTNYTFFEYPDSQTNDRLRIPIREISARVLRFDDEAVRIAARLLDITVEYRAIEASNETMVEPGHF